VRDQIRAGEILMDQGDIALGRAMVGTKPSSI
jgi:hypothetical protein